MVAAAAAVEAAVAVAAAQTLSPEAMKAGITAFSPDSFYLGRLLPCAILSEVMPSCLS